MGKQNTNAQVNLVYQIAIPNTEIHLIHVIKTTIAGIAFVKTIEMMTRIIADMTTREIETSTTIEMTNVVKVIETADIHEKTAQTRKIEIETVDDTTDQSYAIASALTLSRLARPP